MAKRNHRLLSALLAGLILSGSMVTANAATVGATDSGAGTLAKYYSTNATGVGAEKTITVDGEIGDWDESMKIAQGTANDDPRVYRPKSMYEVGLDMYSLYAAYDDSNLYLMWEMTNVQDVVAPNDDYPLTQGTLYMNMNIPFFIALDTGKSDAIGNSGKTTTGGTIWDSGITFGSNTFNRLIAVSTNGANGPYVYGGTSAGLNPVETHTAKTSGIVFKYGKGILSKNIYGINGAYGPSNNRVVGDVCNDSAAWVDFNTKGHTSATMDFHYEMSIPYETLGITKSDVTSNGVGALVIMTSGKSGMDCLPYDVSMNDNADLDDSAGSQENNSFEKSDADDITCAFARIGNGTINPRPLPDPQSDSEKASEVDTSSEKTSEVDSEINLGDAETTVTANANKGDIVTVTLSINNAKNLLGISNSFTYDSKKYKLVSAKGVYSGVEANAVSAGEVKWNANFGDGKKGVSFTKATDLVEIKLEALSNNSGTCGVNTVRDCYDYDFNTQPFNTLLGRAAVSGDKVSDSDVPSDNKDIKVSAKASKGDAVNVTFSGNLSKFEGVSNSFVYDSTLLDYVGCDKLNDNVQVEENSTKGIIRWNCISINGGKESDIVTFKFTAKKNVDGVIGTNTIKELYDANGNDLPASTITAKITSDEPDTDTVTDLGDTAKKVAAAAKKGEIITVRFKAKGVKNAAGIQGLVDFNSSALKYNKDAASSLGVIDADASQGRVAWNILFDISGGKGADLTNETEIAVMTFTALRDIKTNEDLIYYTIKDFYDLDDVSFENATNAAATAEAVTVPRGEGKVSVTAKEGNTVKVYCKGIDAAKALGIVEQLNYDSKALKYVGYGSEKGHFQLDASKGGVVRWSSMFDAKGIDLTANTDLVVFSFTALKDISGSDDVLSYIVDEFYDYNTKDFDVSNTTMVYASVVAPRVEDDNPVDNTDVEAYTDVDSDFVDQKKENQDNETDSATTPKNSDTDKNTDSGKPVESDTHKTSDTDKTKTSDTDKTKTSDTDKTKASDTDKTKTSDTDKPKASDTDKTKTSDTDTTPNTDTGKQDGTKITIMFGDIDDDENITANDANKVLRYSVSMEEFTQRQETAADVNADNTVDAGDSVSVLRFSVDLANPGVDRLNGKKVEITIKFD